MEPTKRPHILYVDDNHKLDLFLIDLWLKDGSGSDLCKRLRMEFPYIPVVFYTGAATLQERKEGMLSGAAAYLVKPCSELVVPMVFRLVREDGSAKVLEPQVHAVRTSAERVKPIPIFTSSDRPLPLSP